MDEVVPFGKVIWQTDEAKSYCCPHCLRWIRSQYEGDTIPSVQCNGPMSDHILHWSDDVQLGPKVKGAIVNGRL